MENNQLTSFWESYKTIKKIAGEKKDVLHKSFKASILSNIFLGICFGLFFPLLNSMFLEKFILKDSLVWLTLIFITGVASLFFQWRGLDFGFTNDLTDVVHNMRLKLGNKIKKIPLQRLNRYRTGEINSILGQAVDESVLTLGPVSAMFFEAVVLPIMFILITLFIDPYITLAILIALPISIPIYTWSKKLSSKERNDNRDAHEKLEADVVEYLQGLAVLKSINQVGKNSLRLKNSIANVRETQKRGTIISSIPKVVMNTLIHFIFLFLLSLGAIWIAKGTFSVIELIALLVIINRINEPLSKFLAISSVFDIMDAGFKKIEQLLSIKNLKVNEPKTMPKEFDITFKNVDFNYLGYENKAIKNANFKMAANAMTAIVGPSGSGKTTLSKLIMRFDDPSIGEIKIGNIDIRQMSQEELMSLISVVFQDVYLFDDTVLNNIRMGNPKASDKEVKKAAEDAYCHEFISRLPNGYNTKVGEIGGALSGGERQRVSIARAILKNAPIVILDEPTSALDTQSEVAVQKALDKLIRNKTVIVIVHRLSTISHANNILVADEGKIIEMGTHEELLKKEGKYYSMYQAQQRIKQWNIA